ITKPEDKETVGSAPGLCACRPIDGAFRAAVQARPSGRVQRGPERNAAFRASFTRLLGVRLQPDGSSPKREKPRRRVPHAWTPGDPPSTAGLNGASKSP